MAPKFLGKATADYLKAQIDSGDPERAKRSLEELCRLFRLGSRLPPQLVPSFETTVVGCVYTMRDHEKVRRWCLNALARFGREKQCIETVRHALLTYYNEPQTMAAAVAAAYKLSANPENVLRKTAFDPLMAALAALQHVSPTRLDLSLLPIRVEKATPDALRLALVLVGLARAPSNTLDPHHSNEEMVRVLGRHDDPMVAQYSVWAITENPTLGVRHLGVPLKDIEAQPINVRAWMLQAVAMDTTDAGTHIDIIAYGAGDPASEARSGLAAGLKGTYFDGLEPLVLDWFAKEVDLETRNYLLEHMARQAGRGVDYADAVLTLYEYEPTGSPLRHRIEAAAEGSPLYRRLRAIDAMSDDLFGGINVTNFNINGPIQGGAISFGGNATNAGNVSINVSIRVDDVRHLLSEAQRLIQERASESADKSAALEAIADARTNPTAEKIDRALTIIKMLGAAAEWGEALSPIASAIAKYFS